MIPVRKEFGLLFVVIECLQVKCKAESEQRDLEAWNSMANFKSGALRRRDGGVV